MTTSKKGDQLCFFLEHFVLSEMGFVKFEVKILPVTESAWNIKRESETQLAPIFEREHKQDGSAVCRPLHKWLGGMRTLQPHMQIWEKKKKKKGCVERL